jgi:hypothetical protein
MTDLWKIDDYQNNACQTKVGHSHGIYGVELDTAFVEHKRHVSASRQGIKFKAKSMKIKDHLAQPKMPKGSRTPILCQIVTITFH